MHYAIEMSAQLVGYKTIHPLEYTIPPMLSLGAIHITFWGLPRKTINLISNRAMEWQ